MISLSDEILHILRAEPSVRRVEYVKYAGGNECWVSLHENRRLDMKRLESITAKHGFRIVRFGTLPSKLPRGLGELLWNGVTHVILSEFGALDKLKSSLGFEPEGIARIAEWAHGPYQLFAARTWEGMRILFDYLDIEMPPPPVAPQSPKPATAPPGPSAPAKPMTPTSTPAPRPTAPTTNAAQGPPPANLPPPSTQKPANRTNSETNT